MPSPRGDFKTPHSVRHVISLQPHIMLSASKQVLCHEPADATHVISEPELQCISSVYNQQRTTRIYIIGLQ